MLVLLYTFFERGLYGGIDYEFTLDNFEPRARAALPAGRLRQSLRIAGLATLLALLIGYPAAYAIARLLAAAGAPVAARRWSCCRSGRTT